MVFPERKGSYGKGRFITTSSLFHQGKVLLRRHFFTSTETWRLDTFYTCERN